MAAKEPDISTSAKSDGYSADVQIELLVQGQRFSVSQMGRDELTFASPQTVPGGNGEVILTVDGQERRWTVSLSGAPQPSSRVGARIQTVG